MGCCFNYKKTPEEAHSTIPNDKKEQKKEKKQIDQEIPYYKEKPILPAGWMEMKDDNGKIYYFHQFSGKTQWEHPKPFSAKCGY